jgi:hypothetical protein
MHADGLPCVSVPVSNDLRILSGANGAVVYALEQPTRLPTTSRATNNHNLTFFIFSTVVAKTCISVSR